ncbi:MAG: PspC domain-containing protein [Tidjanibacter sp.]|nr:PspC domain-containing protein [Tidjanibacter sp.]
MDRRIDVKIGSTAFTIEEGAYRALDNYLDDIRSRIDEAGAAEVMGDLEMRIADLLSGWLGNPNGVVDMYLVRRVQETIGRPEEFGELKQPTQQPAEEDHKRLMRTSGDKVIGGVCGGIAKFTRIDPTLLRIATLLLMIFGGLSLWIYIILWIFMPIDTNK